MLVHCAWLSFFHPTSPQPFLQQEKGDVQVAEEETFKLDTGLDLVVSRSRTGLQRVANLLLATNRMKTPSKLCSDTQLCDTILDHVLQGGHWGVTPSAPPSLQFHAYACAIFFSFPQKLFSRAMSPPQQQLQRNMLTIGFRVGTSAICWTIHKKQW